jgi:tetratricopeptide (TPR) repeat protein
LRFHGGTLWGRGGSVSKNLLAKRRRIANHSGMEIDHHTDSCLIAAQMQWHPHLQQGLALYAAGEAKAALLPLAEAIRISASYHPLFHFLESGLNTELAIMHLQQHNWHEAERLFTRAVFLHHDNATAIAGEKLAQTQTLAPLPTYATLQLCMPLAPLDAANTGIHQLRGEGRYHEAIEQCDAIHKRYHQLAALPWLARARCFAALGEDMLARNDIRHGMDLDRNNSDLLALSLELAA